MAQIEKHPFGSFCWIDLATTDQNAAKTFYSSLFGWAANDFPQGPDMVYTVFQLEGRDSAAAYTLQPEERAQNIPPHWNLYVAVANADDAAARAAELGGNALGPAFDVAEHGRMAIVQDPTGATLCVWQAKANPGTGITGVDGTLCWADLNTRDVARAREFYSGLFGWTIEASEGDPSGYLHIKNGESFIGGIPPDADKLAGVPAHWMTYFQVSDCDASAGIAKRLGATFHVPPMTLEGVGRMSVMADPQGATFAIFQPGRHDR
ncbi:MAG TPA: VOC family protein [Blastocatellia bacterium]|nr:VOC family protein [Blastocatellia bacterium]